MSLSSFAMALAPGEAIPPGAIDASFDLSLLMLGVPIALIVVVGAVLSLFHRKRKKPSSPYRSNARD